MSKVEPVRDLETVNRIEAMLSQGNTWHERRMFLMWELGIFTGLRIGDLIKLRVGKVRGKQVMEIEAEKTHKMHRITISPTLRNVINARCKDMSDTDWLLPSRKHGGHISRSAAYRDIQTIKKMAGLNITMGCHTMRKTFGYQIYQKYKDVAWLMDWFEHSKESITLIYIGIEVDDKKRVTDKMPFSNREGIML